MTRTPPEFVQRIADEAYDCRIGCTDQCGAACVCPCHEKERALELVHRVCEQLTDISNTHGCLERLRQLLNWGRRPIMIPGDIAE